MTSLVIKKVVDKILRVV